MQTITTTLGILAISQLILMSMFYFAYFRKEVRGGLLALLGLCLTAYIIPLAFAPEAEAGLSLASFLRARLAVATPGVLWVIAHLFFVDDREISIPAWALLISYQLLRGFSSLAPTLGLEENSLVVVVSGQLGFLIMVGFSAHVVYMAGRELNSDLVEERRKLRVPFAAGMGLIIALIVGALLIAGLMDERVGDQILEVTSTVSVAAIFVFTLLTNLVTFRLSEDTQLISNNVTTVVKGKQNQKQRLSENDRRIMREIESKMVELKFYKDAELTIGALAKQLSVQEYKLRIIVNRGLGYKNFNQFLNHYRIIEACVLLEDKSKQRQISAVAHAVGFASLSSFNLAFKSIKGVTPSAYRAANT